MDPRRCCFILAVGALLLVVAGGCTRHAGPAGEGEPPAPHRVENRELGVAIADLPAGLAVAANEGATIELVPADGGPGRITVAAGAPERGGVNLVAAVQAHRAEIAGRPGGDYKGQRELTSQIGTAYYSRGRFEGEGGTVEETVVFAVHPWDDRLLEVTYRYPAGEDSPHRVEQLLGLLGEIEGLPMPAAPPADPAG